MHERFEFRMLSVFRFISPFRSSRSTECTQAGSLILAWLQRGDFHCPRCHLKPETCKRKLPLAKSALQASYKRWRVAIIKLRRGFLSFYCRRRKTARTQGNEYVLKWRKIRMTSNWDFDVLAVHWKSESLCTFLSHRLIPKRRDTLEIFGFAPFLWRNIHIRTERIIKYSAT